MTNSDLSLAVFSILQNAGVEQIMVCAGARNAPLVLALKENKNFKIFSFFEERSAAFFALGLIKASQKPVAIMTTSGTAVAELLSATIEATYQGLPLILVTADRPKSYRGSGSPQTIEQVGIFSKYVEAVYDLDVNTDKFDIKWSLNKPLHLNVSFDEPLLDLASDAPVLSHFEFLQAQPFINSTKKYVLKPLIILGEISSEYRSRVIEFILQTKAPVYAESLSQIKKYPGIQAYVIHSSEAVIKKIFRSNLCDAVIRIGGVPTLRFWRDLESEFKGIPVSNYTDLPYSGLSKESEMWKITTLAAGSVFDSEILKQIKAIDEKLEREKKKLLIKYPLSEQGLTNKLSEVIKSDSVYLGNSLPIRNWDQFASCDSDRVYANRGANGIDGQISTYLGWSEGEKKSYCYVGDLTAMYDLASLGLTPQLNQNQRHIIILNNFGGQIFKRVFKTDDFTNAHTTQFNHWAMMWNWNYIQISNSAGLNSLEVSLSQFNVIEILPNAEQTQKFWNEWDLLCQQI